MFIKSSFDGGILSHVGEKAQTRPRRWDVPPVSEHASFDRSLSNCCSDTQLIPSGPTPSSSWPMRQSIVF